jgi:DNA-directed RNA polymerase specialized sigma24 family protein
MPALGSIEALNEKRRRAASRGIQFAPDPVKDLADYLNGPYLSGLPLRVTTWRPDATGQQISDAMVSRLEVQAAMKRLPNHLWYVMSGLYQEEWSAEETARRLRIDKSTVYRRRLEAITAMASYVYEGEWTGTLPEAA